MIRRRPGERAGTLIVRGGRVVYASEGVAVLAERPLDEIVGRPFEEFVDPGERAALLERYARRFRGDTLPDSYESTITLPGGDRRLVEVHVETDGADVLVHLRDAGDRAARRLRLEAVVALGAAIQSELAEERIHARVRDALGALGLWSALGRAEADGLRTVWTTAPAGVAERFHDLIGVPFEGFLFPWTPFLRKAWAEGWVFSDDWATESARSVPGAAAGDTCRAAVSETGAQRAALVRVDQREGAECVLLVVGEWLRVDDAPALRLLGTQIAAALDAARTVADLSRRNADLDALNRVATLASEARDVDALFARASEVLRATAGCAAVAAFALDEAGGELVLASGQGLQPERRPIVTRLTLAGAAAQVVRERVPACSSGPIPTSPPSASRPPRSSPSSPAVARSGCSPADTTVRRRRPAGASTSSPPSLPTSPR